MSRNAKIYSILVIFFIALVCGYWVYAHLNGKTPMKTALYDETAATGIHRVPVVVTPVTIRNFEKRLVVQGNLEAQNIAMVHARVEGTIESIFVDEGDDVIAGKTRLFQIDALKLEKAVMVRRQALAVAGCVLNEKIANLERVEADFYKADIDFRRSKRLFIDGTVSSDAFERAESRHKQAVASHKHAKTLIELAKEQKRQAEAALGIAEKDHRDALVYAPISGKISQRFQEPGEAGDKKKPVLRIEDTAVIEASAFLPSEYYPLITPGETLMRIRVHGIVLEEYKVSYKSPTINQKLRTFEIKSVVKKPADGVVPGAMAEIEVLLTRRKALGVPEASLLQRGGRTVVFLAEEGVARMMEVKTGLESDGWIELQGGSLQENTEVVSMGQFLLDDGIPVTIQRGDI